MSNEIVIYKTESNISLSVVVEDESVWLSQAQMVDLFQSSKGNISEHIKNIFKDGELDEVAVVRKFRTTAKDGKSYLVAYYNLDVIISVGYRVRSFVGVAFRKWATGILKQYMLNGYAVNQRFRTVERDIDQLKAKVGELSEVVRQALPATQGLFFAGQVYDAFKFVREIITSAKSEIILIDNYIDESVLTMMSDKSANVSARIFTRKISQPLALAARKFNEQYGALTLSPFTLSHDRFLIIDRKKLYLIGASLKDLGKKWFGVTEMDPANIPRIVSELKI